MKQPVIKVISRDGYKLYDEDLNLSRVADLTFYNSMCYSCNKILWQYYVQGKNREGSDIILDWNLDDGYGLLCADCYEKFLVFAKEKGATTDHYYDT